MVWEELYGLELAPVFQARRVVRLGLGTQTGHSMQGNLHSVPVMPRLDRTTRSRRHDYPREEFFKLEEEEIERRRPLPPGQRRSRRGLGIRGEKPRILLSSAEVSV